LKKPEQRERLVRAIPKESPRLRDLISAAIPEEIKDPTERQKLLQLLE
jgi:hypothetical protein